MEQEWGHIPCDVKKAFWTQLSSSVTKDKNNLLPLGIYMLCKRFAHIHDAGVKTVAVDQIRGRVGLSREFDRLFVSRMQHIQDGWTNINQARSENAALPLVDLVKIGNVYLVLDGHQQFSVEASPKMESIEAHVIEVEEDTEC